MNAWLRAGRDDSIRRLALQGLGDTEIGRRLGVKPPTVRSVRIRMGLPSVQPGPRVTRTPSGCPACGRRTGVLTTLRADLRTAAARASKSKYGPSDAQMADLAKIKANIAETQSLIEEHNCDA